MAITCPVDLDTQRLKQEVSALYARVAAEPNGSYHFHRGPEYAAAFLGYDPNELATLPAETTAPFAGVGNPHRIAPLQRGETVLDVGCGAGTDLLLAALHVGPEGKAIGVDMTEVMAERARTSALSCGLRNVEVRLGEAEALPANDGSVSVVISNGVINLTPDKRRAFSEIRRVLKPGGRLMLADIIVREELSEGIRRDIDLWTG